MMNESGIYEKQTANENKRTTMMTTIDDILLTVTDICDFIGCQWFMEARDDNALTVVNFATGHWRYYLR
ncbi:hypothetical protein P8452_47746 [Trifolium repens]|nr:hypothetical protein P8452_47746 [Trifolium repens]